MYHNFIVKALILGFLITDIYSQPPLQKVRVVNYRKYEINVFKSYIYALPSLTSAKHAYLTMGDCIAPMRNTKAFYYVEFKNSKGQISKGWVSKQDVLLVDSTTYTPIGHKPAD
jgi:hypothetical protein